MQSEPRAVWEATTKHMPTQEDTRTIWSILAIFSCVMLALSLGSTVVEVLARSPHAVDWAAWTVASSIWLSVALYARSPRYYEKYSEAILRRRIEWYRKSRAQRIRAVSVFALGAAGLISLVFGGQILVGILWPGQPWAGYVTPILPVATAVTTAVAMVTIVHGSARGRASRADKPVE